MQPKIIFACFAVISFLYIQPSQAQQKQLSENSDFGNHPRILLFKGEEKALTASIAKDSAWSGVHRVILSAADQLITAEPVQRIQIGRRLLDKSREALRRIFFLSYAYRTTEDDKYLKRAEKEMLTIAGFSDWNPSHFLDVAEMTMAVAIGYDWLYASLPSSSRATIREAIIKKGLEPSMNPKFNSWLRAEHNWNQVCNAGMTYGALAVYEDQPALAREIINRAIGSIVLPMKDYGPDGIYPEGYGYWGYGTSFNVMFLSAIEKRFGTDFGLNNSPGFLKTGGFMEFMTGPSGKSFNFSDAGENGGFHPSMFWLANKINDPSILWVERSFLESAKPERLSNDRLLPAVMLWKGDIGINQISPPKQNMWIGHGKNPIAMMRTSWTDPNAIYLAMKGGSVSINHAHMDIGSFVMEADGVRWAMDFGMQNYESLESKGIKLFGRTQDAERWTVFRLTNLVHNTLTVNNELQRVSGSAPIVASSNKPGFMHAITDLSSVYEGQLEKSNRGIAVVNNKHVLVRDEVTTLDKETTIRWTMLTPASVKITGKNEATLTKDGKTLKLKVGSLTAVTMKTWSTDPPRDYDAPNPGTTLVGFEIKVPARTNAAFEVLLVPESAGKMPSSKPLPLQLWTKQ
jgi:hypothetical protein